MSRPGPSRRSVLKSAASAATVPLLGGMSRAANASGTSWNVVVICLDQVCVRDMSLVTLPNIDRLSSEGLSCSAAYCASPICAPTRQSWLTGLYPAEHGMISNGHVLNSGLRTMIDVFKDAGYTTAVYGKLHTNNSAEAAGAGFGFDTIWNTNSADFATVQNGYKDKSAFTPFYDTTDKALFDAIKTATGKTFGSTIVHVDQHEDSVITQEALRFLDAHASDTSPFFLYVSLLAPHLPLKVPMESPDLSTDSWYYNWLAADVSGLTRLASGRTDSPGWRYQNDTYKDWSALSDDQRHLLIAKYLGYLEYADHLVGQVIDRIDSLGLDSNTVVVFMADHGEQNGHRGLFLKQTCFDEVIRTPLIYRMPGSLTAGGSYEGLVSAIDILPTLAGLVGLGASVSDVSGLDLSDGLRGTVGATARDEIILADHYGSTSLKGGMTGILDADGWMSVYYSGKYVNKGYIASAGYSEVYDLDNDPDQETNLIDDSATVRTDHTARRKAHYAALRALEFPIEKV